MQRQGFIGGSDATTIMQFKWYDLWLVKTGRAESEDLSDNIAVQLGSYTETFKSWFSYFNTSTVTDTNIGSKQDDKRQVGYRDSFKEFVIATRSEARWVVYSIQLATITNTLVFTIYLLSRL